MESYKAIYVRNLTQKQIDFFRQKSQLNPSEKHVQSTQQATYFNNDDQSEYDILIRLIRDFIECVSPTIDEDNDEDQNQRTTPNQQPIATTIDLYLNSNPLDLGFSFPTRRSLWKLRQIIAIISNTEQSFSCQSLIPARDLIKEFLRIFAQNISQILHECPLLEQPLLRLRRCRLETPSTFTFTHLNPNLNLCQIQVKSIHSQPQYQTQKQQEQNINFNETSLPLIELNPLSLPFEFENPCFTSFPPDESCLHAFTAINHETSTRIQLRIYESTERVQMQHQKEHRIHQIINETPSDDNSHMISPLIPINEYLQITLPNKQKMLIVSSEPAEISLIDYIQHSKSISSAIPYAALAHLAASLFHNLLRLHAHNIFLKNISPTTIFLHNNEWKFSDVSSAVIDGRYDQRAGTDIYSVETAIGYASKELKYLIKSAANSLLSKSHSGQSIPYNLREADNFALAKVIQEIMEMNEKKRYIPADDSDSIYLNHIELILDSLQFTYDPASASIADEILDNSQIIWRNFIPNQKESAEGESESSNPVELLRGYISINATEHVQFLLEDCYKIYADYSEISIHLLRREIRNGLVNLYSGEDLIQMCAQAIAEMKEIAAEEYVADDISVLFHIDLKRQLLANRNFEDCLEFEVIPFPENPDNYLVSVIRSIECEACLGSNNLEHANLALVKANETQLFFNKVQRTSLQEMFSNQQAKLLRLTGHAMAKQNRGLQSLLKFKESAMIFFRIHAIQDAIISLESAVDISFLIKNYKETIQMLQGIVHALKSHSDSQKQLELKLNHLEIAKKCFQELNMFDKQRDCIYAIRQIEKSKEISGQTMVLNPVIMNLFQF